MSASSEDQPGVLRVLQSKEETKRFYNKIAHVYDLLAEHSEQPMREAGLELLAVRPGEHILEIGFGTGHCLKKLADAVGPGGKVYGLDISDKMVELTRNLIHEAGLADRVELFCSDAAAGLPLENGSLDAIFMSFTLELFDTPEIPVVLAECRRLLTVGGRIVVVGISKAGQQGLLIRAFEWTHRHFPNLLDCRPIYVEQALDAASFTVESRRIERMWVPVEIVRAIKPE